MIDIVIGILSLLLLFFLPGFFLTLAIWPKKDELNAEFDILLKCVIGVVLSMILSVLVGIVIYSPDGLSAPKETQTLRLWVILGAMSIIFAVIAWRRGGLRDIMKVDRTRIRVKLSVDEKISQLTAEKRKLQDKIALMESDEYKFDQALVEEAAVRIPALREKIAEINRKIDVLIKTDEREGRVS